MNSKRFHPPTGEQRMKQKIKHTLFVSQTYPEEERPCLSKYRKIYFPDREISLALFFFFFFRLFVLQLFR